MFRFIFCIFLTLACFSAYADEFNPSLEKQYLETVSSHLILHDHTKALQTAAEGISRLPMSQKIRELYIHVLSKSGDERRLLQAWQTYTRDFNVEGGSEGVLEDVAWGLIQKAHLSNNLTTKFTSLIAASMQNDAYSVQTLEKMLQDSNALIREVALHFCTYFGDSSLKKQILDLIAHEPVYDVRKKAIEVAQQLKIEEAKPLFETLLNQDNICFDEKALIVTALIQYYDTLSEEEFKALCISASIADRFLACQAFAYFELRDQAHYLLPLVYDDSRQIRLQALSALGQLQISSVNGVSLEKHLKEAIEDPNPKIALMASWALLKSDPNQCIERIRPYLLHTEQSVRIMAIALIGYSLPLTESLAIETLHTHPDSYVKVNAAYFLAAHRKQLKEASDQLFAFFHSKEPYLFQPSLPSQIQVLVPSSIAFQQDGYGANASLLPAYHQMAQLEILNLLATLKDDRAKEAMSLFLDQHHCDVTTLNLSSLLRFEEGQALELMKEFLNHSDPHKRVEAAIVLALYKKNQDALKILESAFDHVNRDLKQVILMAMGEVASKSSIEFLTEHLYEPSQSLRIQAAAALVRCLRN